MQLVEQLGAAQLALPGLLGAVEELPLLGVDEAGAVAGREELDAGERRGDALAKGGHRVHEDDALVGDDVLVDGGVSYLRPVLETEAACLASSDAEVGIDLDDEGAVDDG